jgi:hypothetical protein
LRITNHHRPKNATAGRMKPRMSRRNVLSMTPVNLTLYCCRSFARASSTRTATNRVRPSGSGSLNLPSTVFSRIATSAILPSLR